MSKSLRISIWLLLISGCIWQVLPQGGPASHVISGPTPPSKCSPKSGDIWYKTSVSPAQFCTCTTTNTYTCAVNGAGAQGPTGATGPTGPAGATGSAGSNGSDGTSGAGYGGTSTTSMTPGSTTGATTITTQAGLAYVVGSCLVAASNATPTAFIVGPVTAYSGTSLTFSASTAATAGTCSGVSGSGAHSDWNLSVMGSAGVAGTNGTNGAAGATGPAGPTGATGPVGPTGPAGSGNPAGGTNAIQINAGGGSFGDSGCTATSTLGNLACKSLALGSSAPTVTPGTAGADALGEGTVPSVGAAVGVDICYADSTQHGFLCSFNNGSYLPLFQGPASSTSGDLVAFNSATGGLGSDSNIPKANVVQAVTPGIGICHFPGASQTCTSAPINLGAGSNEISGNLPVTNLNSGTGASDTTFWRGDGSWQTPAGSGNVSTSGSPATGSLIKFASSTTITNADLTGDITTSGSVATTIKSSVALAGSPTTTTQAAADNSTKIATTAYVDTGLALKAPLANPSINTSSSLGTSTGAGFFIPGTSLTAGSVYYQASGGLTVAKADVSTTVPGVCIAITTTACMTFGTYRFSGSQSWTAGQILYVSDASAGAILNAAPTTSGHFVQRIGVALANDMIQFMPSIDVGSIQ